MKIFEHNEIKLCAADNGRIFILSADDNTEPAYDENAPFELCISGGERVRLNKEECLFEGAEKCGDTVRLTYNCIKYSVRIIVSLTFVPDSSVVVQENSIVNYGPGSRLVTEFSSLFADGIAAGGAEWYKKNISFHMCRTKWQTEGQWKEFDSEKLSLQPSTLHCWEKGYYDLRSVGSWSTGAGYYPCVIAEDKTDGKVWFAEIEGSHNWLIRISSCGAYDGSRLAFEATGCDETNGSWHYELKSGEEYKAPRAFFGTVKGGFEEAVYELNKFKRYDSLVKYESGFTPVAFNDYMDCIWGGQKNDAILPLIKAAAETGCEIFCIDGGWCTNKNGDGLGDYIAKENCSIRELAAQISRSGMTPGIWLEFDACNDTAYGFKPEADWVLKRYGRCIGDYGRHFYNFCNEEVRKYLKCIVKELYDMGFRYIKNDYNQSTGIGCTNTYDGDSPTEGLIRNNAAFLNFIDELYGEFPGLVIENCGSGAMRADNSMLRHFALQSTSDQELYYNNPSIIMGSLAYMPPEKAGIWSYPYPVMLDECTDFTLTEEYRKAMADGRQTVFNMVNAMNGVLYLSGRIDLCDEKNINYIKQAIEIYKDIRRYIPKSRPIYPMGMCAINEKKLTCAGLISDKRLLLSVWNITDDEAERDICLGKYIKNAVLKRVYTSDGNSAALDGVKLGVKMKSMSALFAEFVIE